MRHKELKTCPACHKFRVYSEQDNFGSWRMYCDNCGITTSNHPTHSEARREFQQIKEDYYG